MSGRNIVNIQNTINISNSFYGGTVGNQATGTLVSDITTNTTSNISEIARQLLSVGRLGQILTQTQLLSINNAGQSFFQILTQQPKNFDISNVGITTNTPYEEKISSSKILINWSFDNILVKDLLNDEYVKYANSIDYNGILPNIIYIYIDIKSNNTLKDSSKNEWINLDIINITEKNYDIYKYKNYVVNKFKGDDETTREIDYILANAITNDNNFNIRVYGKNHANDNEESIQARSIIYETCYFNTPNVPSKPINVDSSFIAFDNSCILLYYYVSEVEINDNDPDSSIVSYILNYIISDSKSSSYINYNQLYYENSGNFFIEYKANENIEISLNNIRSGTSYDVSINLKNNINRTTFSEKSDQITTPYSKLPKSEYNIDLSLNIIGNKKFIKTSLHDSEEQYFINLKDNNNNLMFENNNIQYFEITNPYYDNQETSDKGYGKYIDNSYNLASIQFIVNNNIKQKINYHGFLDNDISNISIENSFPNNRQVFHNYINYDQFLNSANNNNKGFRLIGNLQIIDISQSINEIIGDLSSNPYNIKILYNRVNDVSLLNIDLSTNIYIDNFDNIPEISLNDVSFTIISIENNMGIPSVKKFDLNINKIYSNINSNSKILNGNGIITTISPINNTSCDNSKNIILETYEIQDNGIYNSFNLNYHNKTDLYYKNINYNTSIIYTNNILNIKDTLFNVYHDSGTQINKNFTANHYCDYNSFNLDNSNCIINSKLDLSKLNIYEFKNLPSDLSSIIQNLNNIPDLSFNKYTDHNIPVKPYSLLYINGTFEHPINYPLVNDFCFNNISTNLYSLNLKTATYRLEGFKTNFDNKHIGYKWITIKIQKYTNNSFKFHDNNNKLINTEYKGTNNNGPKYIPFKNLSIFNDNGDTLFSDDIISKLSNINDDSVIGFIILKDIYNINKFSVFNKYFSKNNNWIVAGTLDQNTSIRNLYDLYNYTEYDKNKWGSLIYDHERNQYGFYIDPTLVKDDIYINIAIKYE